MQPTSWCCNSCGDCFRRFIRCTLARCISLTYGVLGILCALLPHQLGPLHHSVHFGVLCALLSHQLGCHIAHLGLQVSNLWSTRHTVCTAITPVGTTVPQCAPWIFVCLQPIVCTAITLRRTTVLQHDDKMPIGNARVRHHQWEFRLMVVGINTERTHRGLWYAEELEHPGIICLLSPCTSLWPSQFTPKKLPEREKALECVCVCACACVVLHQHDVWVECWEL